MKISFEKKNVCNDQQKKSFFRIKKNVKKKFRNKI